MRNAILLAAFVVPLVVAARADADEKSGLDSEGFVQKWLVLAPIKMADNESGGDALAKSHQCDGWITDVTGRTREPRRGT